MTGGQQDVSGGEAAVGGGSVCVACLGRPRCFLQSVRDVQQAVRVHFQLASLRLSGVSSERGEGVGSKLNQIEPMDCSSGENQIVPGVHGTGQPGPDMGQPVLGLPGQIQAVASTAFDQDIDGQISLNKDLPSVLVLPERGGAKAFDAMVTPGMEIVDPLSLAKNPGSKIMQKVGNSPQIVKPLFFGFSHSLCKVLRFLEISSQIVQGVWKNSDNKENEGFSDFFSLTRNVKMLISKKIVYYFASWILHDFKKRKKKLK